MAMFDHNTHTKDLIHNSDNAKQFFNKDNFDEEHMLSMIPTQLTYLKQSMSDSLKEMYNNINYYYRITGPLHNHKNYDQ